MPDKNKSIKLIYPNKYCKVVSSGKSVQGLINYTNEAPNTDTQLYSCNETLILDSFQQ